MTPQVEGILSARPTTYFFVGPHTEVVPEVVKAARASGGQVVVFNPETGALLEYSSRATLSGEAVWNIISKLGLRLAGLFDGAIIDPKFNMPPDPQFCRYNPQFCENLGFDSCGFPKYHPHRKQSDSMSLSLFRQKPRQRKRSPVASQQFSRSHKGRVH